MCRSTDYYDFPSAADQNVLKIKAFFIRLSGLGSCTDHLSDSLTLLYPPRINETLLEVSGSNVRPDSPAFLTLHRMVNAEAQNGEAIYGSRERVRAGDGARFEVYSKEEKVLKGFFRSEEGQAWKLECKGAIERLDGGDGAVADVCVAVEGDVALGERVKVVVRKNSRRAGFDQLADIPEESESCCCCCCGGESDGGDLQGRCEGGCGGRHEEMEMELESESEGVGWALDMGIWVMCFGVGLYLVSKASAKSLRRMRLL